MQCTRDFIFLLLIVFTRQISAQDTYKKEGFASYYHDKFEDRQTSSGEKFHQKKMTCAHRTLPFGTMLRVTNLANNKEVVVTVTDRGPFKKGRIIDLSRAAAKKLDFIKDGCTKVQIEVIADITDLSDTLEATAYTLIDSNTLYPTGFAVQVGSFVIKDNMEKMVAGLESVPDKKVFVRIKNEKSKQIYQVMIGLFNKRGEAFGYLDKIISKYPGAFIVELK